MFFFFFNLWKKSIIIHRISYAGSRKTLIYINNEV